MVLSLKFLNIVVSVITLIMGYLRIIVVVFVECCFLFWCGMCAEETNAGLLTNRRTPEKCSYVFPLLIDRFFYFSHLIGSKGFQVRVAESSG